jgi:hypothetical protein
MFGVSTGIHRIAFDLAAWLVNDRQFRGAGFHKIPFKPKS